MCLLFSVFCQQNENHFQIFLSTLFNILGRRAVLDSRGSRSDVVNRKNHRDSPEFFVSTRHAFTRPFARCCRCFARPVRYSGRVFGSFQFYLRVGSGARAEGKNRPSRKINTPNTIYRRPVQHTFLRAVLIVSSPRRSTVDTDLGGNSARGYACSPSTAATVVVFMAFLSSNIYIFF